MVIEQIKKHIKNKEHFLLSGGAGSGKTYTLMQTLNNIFEQNKKAKIACITYTNVAADEIKERSPYENLVVSTIHDFLWSQIKNYQKNLKKSLSTLIIDNTISYRGEEKITEEYFLDKKIEYREYRKLEEGIVSHDEVIKLAHHMFYNYPLLNDIVKDKFSFIFIDEYQDTHKEVVEIFLEFLQKSKKECILGIYGDKMQSIYNDRIGDIDKYVNTNLVKNVVKSDNYRCSKEVIKLLNKIRTDISQEPSGENKTGDIKFIYSQNTDINISTLKSLSIFNEWDFTDIVNTKELYLTHKLIAKEQGFKSLLDSELSNDDVTGDTQIKIIAHLLKIEEIIFLYENHYYNEFIKKTYFKVKTLADKQTLKNKIEELKNNKTKSIEKVLELSHNLDLVKKDDNLINYIESNESKYNSIKDLSYKNIENLYHYREDLSPYSTQHGVKGAEFENVFVILDNGRWNLYNFKYLFEEAIGKESIIERTKKIFYVSCSRAKNNLVVFFHKPSNSVILKAKKWFGNCNVINLDD